MKHINIVVNVKHLIIVSTHCSLRIQETQNTC